MNLRLHNYQYEYRIVSLALDEETKCTLEEQKLSCLFLDDASKAIFLFPEGVLLSDDLADYEILRECNNFDVLEIWETGKVLRRYDDKSNENYLFVTGACNSNCIMCPSPNYSRQNAAPCNIGALWDLAKHIPSDTTHLTITGGEPFLAGKEIFPFIGYLKNKFSNTEFLFLTNGRVFSIPEYAKAFEDTVPTNTIVAIPIHGSCEEIHDMITRAKGSFKQSVVGVKRLLKSGIKVEIRIVVSKLNVSDFSKIAKLIVDELRGIAYVSVIAMEMTGNAYVNKDVLWIPYREAFVGIEDSVKMLIQNGVDVKLYNFPLCTVDRAYWSLCEKSISSNKVRFAESCEICRYKNACSGIFAGTIGLEKNELRPIL